jgi:hypothetical protein
MEEKLKTPMQNQSLPEFKTLVDIVELPSKGYFYNNRKDRVFVEHMTAKDEQILVTPSLVKDNKATKILISRKVKDTDFKDIDLLVGDENAILLFLRMSAYGPYYDVNVISPFTGEIFKETVDLRKIVEKPLTVNPNDDLLFDYTTSDGKHTLKFKLLFSSEQDIIKTKSEAKMKVNGGIDETPLERLLHQIVELDGNKDKMRIRLFIDTLKPKTFKEIIKYIDEVTPGLDIRYTYTCPVTEETFLSYVPINTGFFYPES